MVTKVERGGVKPDHICSDGDKGGRGCTGVEGIVTCDFLFFLILEHRLRGEEGLE